ncbi:MAG: hypothetical protein JST55_01490 [Bacteroidetes bacterium]|nr:hypothetical protein [Bacteroidota bacterium]
MVEKSKTNNLKQIEYFRRIISIINDDIIDDNLNTVVYTSHKKNLSSKENFNNFILNVQRFFDELNIKKITCFREENANWLKYLSYENVAEELNSAYKYLQKLINAKSFTGVFVMETSDLIQFLPHIISFTAFQGGLPSIYFGSDDSNLLFHVCKYSNLHVYYYGSKIIKPSYFEVTSPREEYWIG